MAAGALSREVSMSSRAAWQRLAYRECERVRRRVALRVPAEAVDLVTERAMCRLLAMQPRLEQRSMAELRSLTRRVVARSIADYYLSEGEPDEGA